MSEQVQFRVIKGRVVPIRKTARKPKGLTGKEKAIAVGGIAGGAAAHKLGGAMDRSFKRSAERVDYLKYKSTYEPRIRRIASSLRRGSIGDLAIQSQYDFKKLPKPEQDKRIAESKINR